MSGNSDSASVPIFTIRRCPECARLCVSWHEDGYTFLRCNKGHVTRLEAGGTKTPRRRRPTREGDESAE